MKPRSLNLVKPSPRKRTETTVLYEAMGAINRIPGCRVFRNNTGKLPDKRGIPVTFGLAVGSADLIGSVQVGNNAIPIFIEMKRPGKDRTEEQIAWCTSMTVLGWHGGVAHSKEEALDIVAQARARLVASPDTLAREYRRGVFDERMAVWESLKTRAPDQCDAVLRGQHLGTPRNWDVEIVTRESGKMQITMVER